MSRAQEFRSHAIECRRMAENTHDRENKRFWGRLAERWIFCADLVDDGAAKSDQPRLVH